jgi:dihydrofolate synthase / folylpolyglutamate synthase
MRFLTLEAWLDWQEHLHPNAIDLGLDRVSQVLQRMQMAKPPFRALTVGGTNGKGSCVAFLDAILRAAGYRVGAYSSPHLLRYNERIRIDGVEATDAELCAAFENVDKARGGISLTYFEFGTLAAFDIFSRHKIEVAVLEVGMGGRLDAVNAIDPEGALVASIGLDHQEWLGDDRESIGYEKAGIYRGKLPAICGDRDPPARLLETARHLGADLQVLGKDFDWRSSGSGWHWQGRCSDMNNLPLPALAGHIQLDNAASCVALLRAVADSLPVNHNAICAGLSSARLRARFEQLAVDVPCILDVAHNQDAARVLAENLSVNPATGRTLAVVGMFRDKCVEDVAKALDPEIDAWFAGGLGGARGQSAAALSRRIRTAIPNVMPTECETVVDAFHAARSAYTTGDRIVVFGSFQTVSAILRLRRESGTNYI